MVFVNSVPTDFPVSKLSTPNLWSSLVREPERSIRREMQHWLWHSLVFCNRIKDPQHDNKDPLWSGLVFFCSLTSHPMNPIFPALSYFLLLILSALKFSCSSPPSPPRPPPPSWLPFLKHSSKHDHFHFLKTAHVDPPLFQTSNSIYSLLLLC